MARTLAELGVRNHAAIARELATKEPGQRTPENRLTAEALQRTDLTGVFGLVAGAINAANFMPRRAQDKLGNRSAQETQQAAHAVLQQVETWLGTPESDTLKSLLPSATVQLGDGSSQSWVTGVLGFAESVNTMLEQSITALEAMRTFVQQPGQRFRQEVMRYPRLYTLLVGLHAFTHSLPQRSKGSLDETADFVATVIFSPQFLSSAPSQQQMEAYLNAIYEQTNLYHTAYYTDRSRDSGTIASLGLYTKLQRGEVRNREFSVNGQTYTFEQIIHQPAEEMARSIVEVMKQITPGDTLWESVVNGLFLTHQKLYGSELARSTFTREDNLVHYDDWLGVVSNIFGAQRILALSLIGEYSDSSITPSEILAAVGRFNYQFQIKTARTLYSALAVFANPRSMLSPGLHADEAYSDTPYDKQAYEQFIERHPLRNIIPYDAPGVEWARQNKSRILSRIAQARKGKNYPVDPFVQHFADELDDNPDKSRTEYIVDGIKNNLGGRFVTWAIDHDAALETVVASLVNLDHIDIGAWPNPQEPHRVLIEESSLFYSLGIRSVDFSFAGQDEAISAIINLENGDAIIGAIVSGGQLDSERKMHYFTDVTIVAQTREAKVAARMLELLVTSRFSDLVGSFTAEPHTRESKRAQSTHDGDTDGQKQGRRRPQLPRLAPRTKSFGSRYDIVHNRDDSRPAVFMDATIKHLNHAQDCEAAYLTYEANPTEDNRQAVLRAAMRVSQTPSVSTEEIVGKRDIIDSLPRGWWKDRRDQPRLLHITLPLTVDELAEVNEEYRRFMAREINQADRKWRKVLPGGKLYLYTFVNEHYRNLGDDQSVPAMWQARLRKVYATANAPEAHATTTDWLLLGGLTGQIN